MRQYMSRIVGNRAMRERLCRDILDGKLFHAFVLEGAKGTGKHTVALNVAAALACSDKTSGGNFPCCECHECKKVLEGKSPDVITVGTEGKSTLGVEAIRFLREDVRTVPNDIDFKIYIIENADKMTVQAQNAFLLTLEEPPPYVHFILLCENSDMLLETIRSRAPIFRTEAVKSGELEEYLCNTDRRAAQMRLTSPKEFAELIAASRHGIGTALDYLEPKSFAPVKEMRAFISELCDAATSSASAKVILPIVSKFSQKRDILIEQLQMLSEALTDLMLLKKDDSAELTFFADRSFATELCDRAAVSFFYTFSEAVTNAMESISRNANVRLTLIRLVSDAEII